MGTGRGRHTLKISVYLRMAAIMQKVPRTKQKYMASRFQMDARIPHTTCQTHRLESFHLMRMVSQVVEVHTGMGIIMMQASVTMLNTRIVMKKTLF
jgi:hypothetical protein